MAPVTKIIFKDFVNDGPVPEDNFVVKHEEVGCASAAGRWPCDSTAEQQQH